MLRQQWGTPGKKTWLRATLQAETMRFLTVECCTVRSYAMRHEAIQDQNPRSEKCPQPHLIARPSRPLAEHVHHASQRPGAPNPLLVAPHMLPYRPGPQIRRSLFCSAGISMPWRWTSWPRYWSTRFPLKRLPIKTNPKQDQVAHPL